MKKIFRFCALKYFPFDHFLPWNFYHQKLYIVNLSKYRKNSRPSCKFIKQQKKSSHVLVSCILNFQSFNTVLISCIPTVGWNGWTFKDIPKIVRVCEKGFYNKYKFSEKVEIKSFC